MHDPASVGRGHAARNLERVRHRAAHRQRTALQAGAQRLALDELHHDKRRVGLPGEFEDRQDVRVRQLGDAQRFPLEARERHGIFRQGFRQDFDRDVTVEADIAGAIHLAHAAFAEFGHDFKRADGLADHDVAPPDDMLMKMRELWHGATRPETWAARLTPVLA